jgi:hypothetical protein
VLGIAAVETPQYVVRLVAQLTLIADAAARGVAFRPLDEAKLFAAGFQRPVANK